MFDKWFVKWVDERLTVKISHSVSWIQMSKLSLCGFCSHWMSQQVKITYIVQNQAWNLLRPARVHHLSPSSFYGFDKPPRNTRPQASSEMEISVATSIPSWPKLRTSPPLCLKCPISQKKWEFIPPERKKGGIDRSEGVIEIDKRAHWCDNHQLQQYVNILPPWCKRGVRPL